MGEFASCRVGRGNQVGRVLFSEYGQGLVEFALFDVAVSS